METSTEIINQLASRGVTFQIEGTGGFRVNGVNLLTDREKAALKAHKGAILKALCQSAAVDMDPVVTPAECRTCLRYGPNDHYFGYKLRVIREGEGLICTGKGYSPKGSPWKECINDQA